MGERSERLHIVVSELEAGFRCLSSFSSFTLSVVAVILVLLGVAWDPSVKRA